MANDRNDLNHGRGHPARCGNETAAAETQVRHKHMARATRSRIALSPNDRGLVDSHLSGLGPRGTIHPELNREDLVLLCRGRCAQPPWRAMNTLGVTTWIPRVSRCART